ncbi:hypothetical protein PR048_028666 [Dryococelus australis]|uniref:Uncharacterized protein n=1 Tax=Dryococelus australis TaxID=614101 RepID=A0ABQ9GBN8_9NEOP|nr:hypothetical protein PR048_028666 [Dryococelus australis]
MWESCRVLPLVAGVFSGFSRFLRRCISVLLHYSPLFALIGSQDLTRRAVGGISCVIRPPDQRAWIKRINTSNFLETGQLPNRTRLPSGLCKRAFTQPLGFEVEVMACNEAPHQTGATVTEWLACSPPPGRIGGIRAGRCRRSAGFLGDIPLPPPISFRRRSILASITLIGSQDLAVKSRPLITPDCRSSSIVVVQWEGGVRGITDAVPVDPLDALHDGDMILSPTRLPRYYVAMWVFHNEQSCSRLSAAWRSQICELGLGLPTARLQVATSQSELVELHGRRAYNSDFVATLREFRECDEIRWSDSNVFRETQTWPRKGRNDQEDGVSISFLRKACWLQRSFSTFVNQSMFYIKAVAHLALCSRPVSRGRGRRARNRRTLGERTPDGALTQVSFPSLPSPRRHHRVALERSCRSLKHPIGEGEGPVDGIPANGTIDSVIIREVEWRGS